MEDAEPSTVLVVLGDALHFESASPGVMSVQVSSPDQLSMQLKKTAEPLKNKANSNTFLDNIHIILKVSSISLFWNDAEAVTTFLPHLHPERGEVTIHVLSNELSAVQPADVEELRESLKEIMFLESSEEEGENDGWIFTARRKKSKEEDDALLAEDLMARLKIQDDHPQKEEKEAQLVLQDVPGASEELKTLARWIMEDVHNIVVLSGAGVSVAAGIPDFRTPGSGLYDNLKQYNLPFPEAVFELKFYRNNPHPFCLLAKELWPGLNHSPTLTHSFLTLLHRKAKLRRCYTQNIDGLEVVAELPPDKIVECHGHFRSASCSMCKTTVDIDHVTQEITQHGLPPICKKCKGFVKPDIVFFGEDLPGRFHTMLKPDLKAADLLLIMGTSLMVAPVSMMPDMVDRRVCKRALLNRELVGNLEDVRKNNKNHKRNGKQNRQPDLFCPGDCDENVLTLCRLLGWEEELMELNEKTKIRPKGNHKEQRGEGQKP